MMNECLKMPKERLNVLNKCLKVMMGLLATSAYIPKVEFEDLISKPSPDMIE